MDKELQSLKEDLLEKVKGLADKAKGDAVTDADAKVEAKAKELIERIEKAEDKTEFNSFKDAIAKQVDALELKLKSQSDAKELKNVSFGDALVKAIDSKKDEINAIVKADGKQTEPLRFTIEKAAITMGVDNTIGSGSTQISITQNTGIISVIRGRLEKYLANVSVGATGSNRVMWIEETDEQGTPIFIGEGDGKTQLSVKYVEQTASVKKIAVYGKVTTEMLADANFLASYITNNLVKRVNLKTEDQLWSGDGTGDNLTGLKTKATAFSAGALANQVATANEFDVLTAIALQVNVANGVPVAVGVHPSTVAKMKALKSTTGEPLYKQYTDFMGEMVVNGLRIVETTAVTAGEFIGGDTTVANVLFRESVNVQVGLDGNDFTNNLKTILVEQRLVQFVSANDTPVIVKGTFAAAKALLDPAVADS
jgi:HK97 family phage major capsid protein